ncbi:MAG TPA: glutamine synthetase family protein [Actinomycetota bacterium]|nr:glutamine synthetase family protein [Actinomycetota bacterium]
MTGERLRLFYSDVNAVERSKYLFPEDARTARAAFCLTVFPLTLDREILQIPGYWFDVGAPDMEARVDPETMRLGWEGDGTIVAMADLTRDHEPVALDSRHILRSAVEPWVDRGLIPQLAFEFEFYLMRRDDGGRWVSIDSPGSRVYGTGPSVDPDGVVEDIVAAARASGFPVESYGSEFDDAQFEVNLHYDDAMRAADDAFLFRLLSKEVAHSHGVHATYLGRPFAERGGSGLHLNVSFRRADDGSNALYDPAEPDGLTPLARRCVAGMLAHHEGAAAICAPTVNAYKRLVPDMLNGYWANWGHDDRTVGIRISPDRGAATRLENRVPDGSANPYLVAAAELHACRFGVDAGLELQPEQPTFQEPNTSVRIPPSLDDALKAFEADRELCEALGPDLVTAFTMLKRAEWDRYLKAGGDPAVTEPTDWELNYYLPFY